MGLPAAWPHAGQTSFRVYRPQAPHFFRTDRIASVLPVELRFAAFRGQRLDDAIGRLLDLLLGGLVIRRPHDDPVARRPDILDLDGQAIVLLDGLRERLADVHRPIGTEVHRLDEAVDRDVRRDDVLAGDLDERLHPRSLEALVLEGVFLHHALLERAVERAERVEEGVPELLPARFHGLAEARGDDSQEVLRLLLVLPLLGLLAGRLRDRGAADLAQHGARGSVEDDLFVAAILALDPEEPARGLRNHLCTSTSSNFFARMPGRWWALWHSRHRKRRWIFFVGFSRPSGFGRGKPPYPAVTRRNRRWPARSSDRGRFFTRSTSSSTCLLQNGQ